MDDDDDEWISCEDEVKWDDVSGSFVGWKTLEGQPKDDSNLKGVIKREFESLSEYTPHVKTSAITRVGLQELLELIDDKLKIEKVVERSVFERKWRPHREEDTSVVVR